MRYPFVRFAESSALREEWDDAGCDAGDIPASEVEAKITLLALIDDMKGGDSEFFPPDAGAVSEETAEAARNLIRLIPVTKGAPKVAPDGEGGIIFVWENCDRPVLVGIDGYRLRMVENAATDKAIYHDDVSFDGRMLPSAFSTALDGLWEPRLAARD